MRQHHARGFTLVELMITLAVAAIIVASVVPNMGTFLRNNRLTSGVNDMLHSLNLARTEAIKRQAGNVVVCGSDNPTDPAATCSYKHFNGWIVFVDTDQDWQHGKGETIIESHAALDATVTVKPDANDNIVSYGPTGFANLGGVAAKVPTTTLVLCDSRGVKAVGNQSTARALFISRTGRARASNTAADVNVTATKATGACP